ncbi:uncharacterized protein LOC128712765 [Anopheles marshallii]|uniref:uncharacterized protein LOC128712765 n=1 Tax=Anopheles marshallii TaxID=1521116 RepID=UPI00237A9EA6|nr:uncharacterized protein LOC128712765 [Anopheles marshallii]
MADQRPSTSQQQQQNQQQQQQHENRQGRKRRLSMNRKKGNKKGARKQDESVEPIISKLLPPVIQSLSTCPPDGEMSALIAALQPLPEEVDTALNMVKDDLHRVLQLYNDKVTIYEFGSIKSALLLKDSDIDFYIHYASEKNDRAEQTKLIHIICSRMDRDPCFTGMVKILGAKVPLLRAVHVRTNLQCDINFSNARGCYNSKFIHAIMKYDVRIHQLTMIVKFWAQCAYILTPHKQMNSYCLIMMVIFYLQTRKLPVIPSIEDMQKGIGRIEFGPWNLGYPQEIRYKTLNANTVKGLLMGFFKYYLEFDFAKNVISPFVGRLFSLEELEKKTIRELVPYYRAVEREDYPEFVSGPCVSIQDPFELNVNVGKVLRMGALLDQMKLSLKHAYDLCQRLQSKEFSKLLIALFTDVQRCPKKVKETKNPNAPTPSTSSSASPSSTTINGTVAPQPGPSVGSSVPQTGSKYTCRLPPFENELYLVKQILQARDPGRKTIITEERIRQLWLDCMPDFIEDILRKLYMVKVELIDTPAVAGESGANRTYQLTCERQVFIARKRISISNEEDLKREIEISKSKWERNHQLQFNTRAEMVAVDGAIELRVPIDQPKNGPFRLFIDTCFLVHIRKCLRGYFMVMLAKAKEKARQSKQELATVHGHGMDGTVDKKAPVQVLPAQPNDGMGNMELSNSIREQADRSPALEASMGQPMSIDRETNNTGTTVVRSTNES